VEGNSNPCSPNDKFNNDSLENVIIEIFQIKLDLLIGLFRWLVGQKLRVHSKKLPACNNVDENRP
jgi:hypothetical protein